MEKVVDAAESGAGSGSSKISALGSKSYLAKIVALEGSKDVAVGQPIAVTVEDAADWESVEDGVTVGSSIISISRAAKLLIQEHGLDASSLRASGAHGRLLKGDVLAAIKSGIGSSKGPLKEALARKDLKKDDHWVADEKRFKINIDATFTHLDNKCGIAVLARNSLGKVKGVNYKIAHASSALEAEAKAAVLAVQMGEKLKLEDYIVETTSWTLKEHIEENKMRDNCPGLLARELKFLSGKSQILWSRVNLNANQAVRFVARAILEGRIDADPSKLMRKVPSPLAGLLMAEEALACEAAQKTVDGPSAKDSRCGRAAKINKQ
ncbi:hypothetical protein ABKV19_023676 [Rosa sericea]